MLGYQPTSPKSSRAPSSPATLHLHPTSRSPLPLSMHPPGTTLNPPYKHQACPFRIHSASEAHAAHILANTSNDHPTSSFHLPHFLQRTCASLSTRAATYNTRYLLTNPLFLKVTYHERLGDGGYSSDFPFRQHLTSCCPSCELDIDTMRI